MKILTLNTWNIQGPWNERWEIIFKGLQKMQPDIVAFQEVQKRGWADEIKRRSGFEYSIFPDEPGGLMLLTRFPVQEWECITMVSQSPTEDYKRYALYAKIETDAECLSVFNTHLSWRLEEGEIREHQIGEILNFIRRQAKMGRVFALGDFNAPPDTTEIRRVMLEGGFIDLFGVTHPEVPGFTWNHENAFAAKESLPDRRIDYIFMRGISITKVRSVQLVFTESENGIHASDHYGVLAEIHL